MDILQTIASSLFMLVASIGIGDTAEKETLHISNDIPTMQETTTSSTTMLVAGGCFWCVEADLEKTPGVIEAVSGYAGGETENPTYENYSAGGHREVVEVTYDPSQITFEEVAIVTIKTTDPTDPDGTFYDRGEGYTAALYYTSASEKEQLEQLVAEIDEKGPYEKPLTIAIEERPTFWPAEDYHQNYYKGTLSKLKYGYYRNASGRDEFIETNWGSDRSPRLPWREEVTEANDAGFWTSYKKPNKETLKNQLPPLVYKVTQEEGTEPAGSSPLDAEERDGIFVDILSGEPLFSSRDKYDSGTGWPSFVRPIAEGAVTEHEDFSLFSRRIEIRSAIADNHLGHVFNDGPADRGGLRYCMNGVALRFIPKEEMVEKGYEAYVSEVE